MKAHGIRVALVLALVLGGAAATLRAQSRQFQRGGAQLTYDHWKNAVAAGTPGSGLGGGIRFESDALDPIGQHFLRAYITMDMLLDGKSNGAGRTIVVDATLGLSYVPPLHTAWLPYAGGGLGLVTGGDGGAASPIVEVGVQRAPSRGKLPYLGVAYYTRGGRRIVTALGFFF